MPENDVYVLLGWVALVSGCGTTEPVLCGVPEAAITVSVRNGAGQALGGLTVTDTVRRSGAVVKIVIAVPDTLPETGLARVPIATNEMSESFRQAGDDVVVVVAAAGRVGTGLYRLASDGCSVTKLAGPDTLTVR
jgi:hypothetical protein